MLSFIVFIVVFFCARFVTVFERVLSNIPRIYQTHSSGDMTFGEKNNNIRGSYNAICCTFINRNYILCIVFR